MAQRLLPFVLALLLAAVTGAVFAGVRDHSFLNYDDDAYVTDNPHVKEGWSREGFRWALTASRHNHWHPLTWLSHMTDVEQFGLDAGRHHLSSLLLHVVNSVLLLFVLTRMTGRLFPSAFVAGLFALHPLHVESVAWIADRKDLLAGFFWLLGIGAYAHYAARPSWLRYALLLPVFVLGLMSKAVLVTLPLVLLVLDYWPLGRFSWEPGQRARVLLRLLGEKILPFAIMGVGGLLALSALELQAPGSPIELRVRPRHMADAAVFYVEYIAQGFWPRNLALPYPPPETTRSAALMAAGLLWAITALALLWARRRPWFLAGWAWYGVSLLPVIGLLEHGPHSASDRYTYVPLIGLFIVFSWGIAELLGRWRRGSVMGAVGALLVLGACGWVSARQLAHWKDSETLFRHAIRVTEGNFEALNSLGTHLARHGSMDEAIQNFREAARIRPDFQLSHYNLGVALQKRGETDQAIEALHRAFELKPRDPAAHAALGEALASKGKLREAARHLRTAAYLEPTAAVHVELGKLLEKQGERDEALTHYRFALELEPGHPAAASAVTDWMIP